jgi:hypothetical protein
MLTVVESGSYAEFVGVNDTDNVWVPAERRVPRTGLYVNVPGTLAVALSCVDDSEVPYTMFAGVDHVNPADAL